MDKKDIFVIVVAMVVVVGGAAFLGMSSDDSVAGQAVKSWRSSKSSVSVPSRTVASNIGNNVLRVDSDIPNNLIQSVSTPRRSGNGFSVQYNLRDNKLHQISAYEMAGLMGDMEDNLASSIGDNLRNGVSCNCRYCGFEMCCVCT